MELLESNRNLNFGPSGRLPQHSKSLEKVHAIGLERGRKAMSVDFSSMQGSMPKDVSREGERQGKQGLLTSVQGGGHVLGFQCRGTMR